MVGFGMAGFSGLRYRSGLEGDFEKFFLESRSFRYRDFNTGSPLLASLLELKNVPSNCPSFKFCAFAACDDAGERSNKPKMSEAMGRIYLAFFILVANLRASVFIRFFQ